MHVHTEVFYAHYRADRHVQICKLLNCVHVRLTFEGRIRAPMRGNTVAPPNSTSDICDAELEREREGKMEVRKVDRGQQDECRNSSNYHTD